MLFLRKKSKTANSRNVLKKYFLLTVMISKHIKLQVAATKIEDAVIYKMLFP